MGLDVWFRDDVGRILAAVLETNDASTLYEPLDASAAEIYQQGFRAAVRCVAVGFGIILEGERDGKVQDL